MSDREKTKGGIYNNSRKKKPKKNHVFTVIDNTINHREKTKRSCGFCGGNHSIKKCNIKCNLGGGEWSGADLKKYLLYEASYTKC